MRILRQTAAYLQFCEYSAYPNQYICMNRTMRTIVFMLVLTFEQAHFTIPVDVANSVDHDQTPRYAASVQGLNCLPRSVCSNSLGKYGRCLCGICE